MKNLAAESGVIPRTLPASSQCSGVLVRLLPVYIFRVYTGPRCQSSYRVLRPECSASVYYPPRIHRSFVSDQCLPCSVCFCVYLPRIHRSSSSDQRLPCSVCFCVYLPRIHRSFSVTSAYRVLSSRAAVHRSFQCPPCPVESCCCTQEFPVPTVSCRVLYCFKAVPESRVNFLSVPNIRLSCQRVFGE